MTDDPVARLKAVQAQLQGMAVPGVDETGNAVEALRQPDLTDAQMAAEVLRAYEGLITSTRALLQDQLEMVEQLAARRDQDEDTATKLTSLRSSFEDQLVGLDKLYEFLQAGNPEHLKQARVRMQQGAETARKLQRAP